MSDDEDYMSDKFLTGCVENDIRPGLLSSHSDKRSFKVLKRKREQDEINKKKNPSIKLMESEKRKEGLEKPIEQDNKGFAMLQKMGYKPGSSIGKNETGRTEPVTIEIKAGREGLGRSQMRKELYEKKVKEIKENSVSANEFRSRMTEKVLQKQMESDCRKSQKICERLDMDNGILKPLETWYWFSSDPDNGEQSGKLKKDMKRRRKNYEYDSLAFNDEYEDDNVSDIDIKEDDSDSEDTDIEESQSNLSVDEKLKSITKYLRNTHLYCIWCCVKYNNETELIQECPGRTREDH